MRRLPDRIRPAGAVLLRLFLAGLGLWYLTGYFAGFHPTNSPFFPGWLGGLDQSKYFEAATAYHQGDLDPARHYYLPGYSLLVAPFVGWLGVHAFLPVDLACFLAVGFFFIGLCDSLRIHRLVAMALLCLSLLAEPAVFDACLWPWNSTPVAALQTAVVFLYLRHRRSRLDWLLMGLLGGLIVLFRPLDLVLLLPVYAALAAEVGLGLWRGSGGGPGLGALGLAVGGGVAGLGLGVLAYVSVHGLGPSAYLTISKGIGFDFSQLAGKFYVLFIDPISVYTAGDDHRNEAILHRLPWLVLGLCGLITALARRDRVSVLAFGVGLHLALYTAYVDLIPTGVWRFGNIHYFKVDLPFLALFAWLFVTGLARVRTRLLHGVVLALVVALSALHLDLEPVALEDSRAAGVRGFEVTLAAPATIRALDFPGVSADFPELFWHGAQLSVDGRDLLYGADFRPLPASWGARIVLLRPVRVQHLSGRFMGEVDMPPDFAARLSLERFRIGYGLPRWVWPVDDRFAFPDLAPGTVLDFTAAGARALRPYRGEGWALAEPTRTWTDGRLAVLNVRLSPPAGEWEVRMAAAPFERQRLRVTANGREVLRQTVTQDGILSFRLPKDLWTGSPAADAADIRLTFHLPDARLVPSDGRTLGLSVQWLVLTCVPESQPEKTR